MESSNIIFNEIETQTYNLLKSLPQDEKIVMWKLIKKANHDGIVNYLGSKNSLCILIEKNLLRVNVAYGGRGLSLFILPRCQTIIPKLKLLNKK